MELAKRLSHLPFYLYPAIEAAVNKAKKRGRNIIDLSTGEPEFATPDYIINELKEAVDDPLTHRYGDIQGYRPFRRSIAEWYERRFNVAIDPDKEVITFIGSKEGIAFLPLAIINRGDSTLIPDPGYPSYRYAAVFAGAELIPFKLRPETGYLPDFSKIHESVAHRSKLIFLNYPNNPTGAIADEKFFDQAIEFAKKHDILICHDATYSEITFDGYRAPSFIQSKGSMDVGIEFHSLSKTFNMTGWRVGFAVGNKKIVKALMEVKRVFASGHFPAMEIAGGKALDYPPAQLEVRNHKLQNRRDFIIDELTKFNIEIAVPQASFYIWLPVPNQVDSLSFVIDIILKTGVVIFPGIGYGNNGEGWLRIALVQAIPRIKEAIERLKPYL